MWQFFLVMGLIGALSVSAQESITKVGPIEVIITDESPSDPSEALTVQVVQTEYGPAVKDTAHIAEITPSLWTVAYSNEDSDSDRKSFAPEGQLRLMAAMTFKTARQHHVTSLRLRSFTPQFLGMIPPSRIPEVILTSLHNSLPVENDLKAVVLEVSPEHFNRFVEGVEKARPTKLRVPGNIGKTNQGGVIEVRSAPIPENDDLPTNADVEAFLAKSDMPEEIKNRVRGRMMEGMMIGGTHAMIEGQFIAPMNYLCNQMFFLRAEMLERLSGDWKTLPPMGSGTGARSLQGRMVAATNETGADLADTTDKGFVHSSREPYQGYRGEVYWGRVLRVVEDAEWSFGYWATIETTEGIRYVLFRTSEDIHVLDTPEDEKFVAEAIAAERSYRTKHQKYYERSRPQLFSSWNPIPREFFLGPLKDAYAVYRRCAEVVSYFLNQKK